MIQEKSARVTRGGLNAGDLPVESRAEGTGPSLGLIEAHVERTSERWGAGPPAALTLRQSDAG